MRRLLAAALLALVACRRPASQDQYASAREASESPERYLPGDLASRPDSLRLVRHDSLIDTDDEGQPDTLPTLPTGMDLGMIRTGDSLYRTKAGCVNCHGTEAQGLARRGKTLTVTPHFVLKGSWGALDSLISVGMSEAQTRSPIAMPPRGQHSDLNANEIRAVAAYIWAISQAHHEPWPGGHLQHARLDPRSSARTAIP